MYGKKEAAIEKISFDNTLLYRTGRLLSDAPSGEKTGGCEQR